MPPSLEEFESSLVRAGLLTGAELAALAPKRTGDAAADIEALETLENDGVWTFAAPKRPTVPAEEAS